MPPTVRKMLEVNKKESRKCELYVAGGPLFEARDESRHYVVNLQDRTCNYRAWAISGIPCMHAMAAISYERDDPEKYCHQFLTKEAYLRTYSENINPMPDEVTWPVVEHDPILPPLITRMPGRPKKNKRGEPNEPPPTS